MTGGEDRAGRYIYIYIYICVCVIQRYIPQYQYMFAIVSRPDMTIDITRT